MSLLTRCPRCNTLFRVTPAQLQVRGGKVRCGRCMNVFDGFQALAVEQEDAVSEPVRFAPESPASGTTSTPGAPPKLEQSAESHMERPDTRPMDAVHEDIRAAPVSVSASETRHPSIETAPRTKWSLAGPRTTAGWIAACALTVIVLALQLVYAARGELAARNPTLKAMFSSLCANVGCNLGLPRDPELVKIEASDVRMMDAGRPQLVQLTATLRSYAGYYVAYPALDLVLTNANEHALARRVFVPQEYLDRNRDPNAGFPPHAEITIALDLDTGDHNPAGFRLDLLAAP
jgi:predicted Zn finger-like uncharacterized protein